MGNLTVHQKEKAAEISAAFKRNNEVLLLGSAGVGKTYLVDTLIDLLIQEHGVKRILCTAPTNQAVKVLRSKITNRYNQEVMTVHQSLRLKREIDKRTGEVRFKPDKSKKTVDDIPLKVADLIIIDESSMCQAEIIKLVRKESKRGALILYVGDDKQLPPVKEPISLVMMPDSPVSKVELTEIIRQGSGSPIIELSRNLDLVFTKKDTLNEKGEGFVFSNDENKITDILALANGSSDFKYIAYTNAKVDRINKIVREKIYGNPKLLEKGESIILSSPMGKYFNGDEVLIEDYVIFNHVATLEGAFNVSTGKNDTKTFILKCYNINPQKVMVGGVETLTREYIAIHEDSMEEYKNALTYLEIAAKNTYGGWPKYYKFKETFLDYKYNHAITAHKSQGSTFKQAVIDVADIMVCRDPEERGKLMYTAVTRAAELIILTNI